MTKTQNGQLSSHISFYALSLSLCLGAFFVVAQLFDLTLYNFLGIGLALSLYYLFTCQFQLTRQKSFLQVQVQDLREKNNLVETDIDHENKSIESFKQKIVNYSQLKGVTEELSMCLTLDDTSKTLSKEVNRLFGDRDSTIILYLFHSKTGELGLSSSQKGQMRVNIKDKKGDIFDRWLVKNMQSLLVNDTRGDYRFDMEKLRTVDDRNINSLISVPLMVRNKSLGILRVDSPKRNRFSTEDLRLLTTIGHLGSLAIENAQLYERVENLAIRDGLTNLYLRRYLLDRMTEEIGRHIRRKKPLSFLMMDIDKFKPYNDKYGHIAGDIVLRTIGGLLIDYFEEPGNLICRFGGEEFAVLLEGCPKNKAMELARDFKERVKKETIILRREKTNLTISIGVATFPKDASMREELIQKADQALYQAKQTGRDRVCTL